MNLPERTNSGAYFANLDGLRFFAFLIVFLSHCIGFLGYSNPSRAYTVVRHFLMHGHLGVDFFFVLSGFLISYLLFKEIGSTGKIKVSYFYLRRAFRILPVYFIVIVIGFFIVPAISFVTYQAHLINFPVAAGVERLPWYLLFVSNFDLILTGQISMIVAGLWSISVEEQFYLVWPWILNYFKGKKIVMVFYVILIISFFYRCYYGYDQSTINFSTFSVMSDLCVGALLSYYTLHSPAFKRAFISIKRWQIVAVYLAGFSLFPLRGFAHYYGETIFRLYLPFESLIFSAFFSFIILEQNFSENSLFKLGRSRSLTYLGKISYGLYCYHMIAMLFCVSGFLYFNISVNTAFHFVILIVLSLLTTIGLAFISFVVLEKRLINFKEKYSVVRLREEGAIK
jgi:peptidoglycan/LPS O-acetylase OafA/YrhL